MVNAKKSAEEILKRRKARSSLSNFILYLKPAYIVSTFFTTVCKEIDQFIDEIIVMQDYVRKHSVTDLQEKVENKEIRIPKLILQAPPRCGKTDIVSRFLPAYFLGRFPHFKVRALAGGESLTTSNNRDVQQIMMSPEYQMLFGNIIDPDNCIKQRRNMDMFDIVVNNEIKGSYSCATVGGNIMGTGCNLLIVDDPIKNDEMAHSSTQNDKLEHWFLNTAMSRCEIPFGVILMHQRWSCFDLVGRLLQAQRGEWSSIKFKAIQDDGTSLIPELLPLFRLQEAQRNMTNFEAMYQQEPVPRGGHIIKSSYFKRYTIIPQKISKKYIVVDSAMKTGSGNDYTAIAIFYYTQEKDYYLINMIRKKMESPELLQTIKDLYQKYSPSAVYIEDKSSGTGMIQFLKQDRIPVIELKAVKDKFLRVQDILPKLVNGFCYIPENAHWVFDFLQECEQFTDHNGHLHDDQVDVLAYALSDQCVSSRGLNINPNLIKDLRF